MRIELRSELCAFLQVHIELPSHRSSMRRVCMIELLIMYHASKLEVRESGCTVLACPIVCAFDCACMHSLCKRSISITVCLMKFNLRSLMKHNMRKHHESEGEGWHTAFGADPGGQNYVKPHGDPPRFVPGFLDKTDFPRLLTPWARYPQDPSTVPTRSRLWTLPGSPWMYRCWSPVPIYPLGLDKTNFPRIPENILYLVAGVIKSV